MLKELLPVVSDRLKLVKAVKTMGNDQTAIVEGPPKKKIKTQLQTEKKVTSFVYSNDDRVAANFCVNFF